MAMCGGEVSPKLIVLGEVNVGKTSILEPTIGAGLSTVPLMVDGTVQTFNIWDTAGTPQFRSVVPMYCRQAAIAVIVFDLTQAGTFDAVRTWYDFVRETADPIFLLIGNKLDLKDDREVDRDAAKELAANFQCGYVEMSACTREGIEEFQGAILECARQSLSKLVYRAPSAAAVGQAKPKEDGCC
jgi:small GTP-binding protein